MKHFYFGFIFMPFQWGFATSEHRGWNTWERAIRVGPLTLTIGGVTSATERIESKDND